MTITTTILKVGSTYSRHQLAEIFDEPELKTSREGVYHRQTESFIPFFVTLDKENADPSIAYNDYFEDGLFFWESQNNNTLQTNWIRRIISKDAVPLLFVRKLRKLKGVTQPFFYAGRLSNPDADVKSSRPVKFAFQPIDLPSSLPRGLASLVAWRPATSRKGHMSQDFREKVDVKRKAVSTKGQGLEADPRVRKAIEMHAMMVATNFYEKRGYSVEDVSSNHPYDLLCTKSGAKLRRVEVKGTRGDSSQVNLTIGEVQAAREVSALTDLFIVFDIEVDVSGSNPKASQGKHRLVQRWVPLDEDLSPTMFRYRVPSS